MSISKNNIDSLHVIAKTPEDFTKIIFAANQKNVTIKEESDEKVLDHLAKYKETGARVLVITFGDSNGTRQAFEADLCNE